MAYNGSGLAEGGAFEAQTFLFAQMFISSINFLYAVSPRFWQAAVELNLR